MGGMFLLVSLYLQSVAGLAPLQAGLWLLPQMVAMIIGTLAAPVLLRWVRRADLHRIGITMIGFAVLIGITATGGPLVPAVGFTVACAGIGGATAQRPPTSWSARPPADQPGSASAISETGNELGVGLGIALLGSIGTLIYRAGLGDGAPADAASGITRALTLAAQLPAGQAETLAAAARQAFTQGLVVVAVVGTLTLAAVLIACWLRLGRRSAVPADCRSTEELRSVA